jgi:ribosomal protein S18 acetylase RimI-like enzyme
VIRDVTKVDFAGMVGILDDIREFSSLDIACCRDCLQDYVEGVEPTYRFICSEDDSGIDGFACFDSDTLSDGVVEVYWVVVAPRKQKNGIGSLLLSHIESEARMKKARMIVLETESDPLYVNARRLYEKCGFAREAVIKDFYHEGDDKVMYVKRLG